MSTTTYTVTMAELKEPAHNNMWPNYGSPVHLATGRFNHPVDSTPSQHPSRPRGDHQQYPYSRYSQEEADAYDRQVHPSLTAHHSYPNLKRSFQQSVQPPYTEMVQDLRDDGSKLSVNHDHKLLSFKRVQDIDVTSGRREMDLATILAEERAIQAKWPRWKKIWKTIVGCTPIVTL